MSFAWSFTSLGMFRTCPKQYEEVRVLKNFVEVRDEKALWGDRVHKAIEAALRDGTPLPYGMDVYEPVVAKFRTLRGTLHVENQLAITEGFQPCEWFDKQTWCRGIIDALWIDGVVAKAVDWKTGKFKPNSDQLVLFALLVSHHYPEVQEVRTMFMWLKTGQSGKVAKFTRDQIPKMWEPFMIDVQRLRNCMDTSTWVPKTSGLCSQWCPVVTCQYNGKRRNW